MMGSTANGAEHPMNFLLAEDFSFGYPQAGEIREGNVVAHRGSDILVDIGAKSEGIIPSDDINSLDATEKENLTIGNQVRIYVVNPEDSDGNIVLSYSKALEEEDWLQAQQLLESQEVYQGRVIGFNRGGILVKVGMVRGFVPASQLNRRQRPQGSGSSNEERLSQFVGEEITTKVIEVDRSRNRLIMSERAAFREIRAAQRAKLLEQLNEGDVCQGRVVNLADFGAFVDIGGVEGLVHLSELSWKRVNHPSEVLEVGDQIEVFVLRIDTERNRIALSLKRMEPDPWTLVEENYSEGALVEATITKLTKYGAFARLNDGFQLEGLIHISEMSVDRVEHPQDIVSQGEVVAARIIRVDSKSRQLGLSLKQVASERFIEADLALAEGTDSE
jgi:small subunit ribosomal protein S1